MMKFKHFLIILIILFAIGLVLIDKSSADTKTKISNSLNVFEKTIEENGSIDVYFCPEEECNKIMTQTISSANEVSCAFYDLNDNDMFDLLNQKNAQLIMHYENFETEKYSMLGDDVFSRETEGLMHDKFCILDDKKVITGSHNPTQGKNHDNVLIIESSYLAKNYDAEFSNLIRFSPAEKIKTKQKKIIFNGYELENYFCPQDNCQHEILDELNKAESSIYFLTYTFTDKEIAAMLVNKKNAGIEVRGAIEGYQGKTYWVYPQLIEGNVTVIVDNENVLQHNKVFIIDNSTVITGSFNPTKSADTKNDENIIILREPEIVKEYIENFNYLYGLYSE